MASYDLATLVGQTRQYIPDRDLVNAVWSDEELTAFLANEVRDPQRAAAAALEVMASDQALTLKVIQLQDLRTDGATLSRELRERAADLRAQALRNAQATHVFVAGILQAGVLPIPAVWPAGWREGWR